MKYFNTLIKQSSFYFVSQILVMLAGIISFPIWTRTLSTAEYGLFSLFVVTISLGVGFSKFGLQHAALRFHSDFKEKIIDLDQSYYYSTLFIGSLFISGTILFSALLIEEAFFKTYIDESILKLLPLIILLIFLGSIISLLTIFLRADNKGGLHSTFIVTNRYGKLLFALIFVFLFYKSLYGLFLGYAIAETLILIVLIALFKKNIKITKVSFNFLKEAIKYSFPLIWMELSNLLLNVGDRYIIQIYLGSESVGIYSAGYNISNMAQSFLVNPLRLAIIPIYLNIWNKEGREATEMFLNNTLKYYFMFAIPIIMGMSLYGREIITILATSKYSQSADIIPYIIFSLVLYGANPILAAGLRIHKKTKILMYLSLIAGVINILLNIFLIPRFGILGAAYATLTSYGVLISAVFFISSEFVSIKLQLPNIIKYLSLSVSALLLISYFPADGIGRLLMKAAIAATFYLSVIIVSEKDIRNKIIFYATKN